MDLFQMMGFAVPKPQEKVKKEEQKKESKKKDTTPAVNHMAGQLHTGFGDYNYPEGTLTDIQKEFRKEYPGALCLAEFGTGASLKVALDHRTVVDSKKELSEGTMVAFGTYQYTTPETMSVSEALKQFAEQFPEFAGASAYFYEETGVLAPFVKEVLKEPAVTFPCTIGYGSEVVTIDKVPDTMDYRKEVMKAYEKVYHAKLSGIHYSAEAEKWLPVYATTKATSNGPTSSAKKNEKKYALPVSVYTPHETFTVSREDMGNAEDVTVEDVRKILESRYFEYSKERTVMDYDKERNTFVAILKSSTKGAVRSLKNGDFDYKDGVLISFKSRLP